MQKVMNEMLRNVKRGARLCAAFFMLHSSSFISEALAQETHYHKGLRSQEDNDKMGIVAATTYFNGSGMYWSRVRNVDDVTISHETREDTLARMKAFTALCRKAYDAYEAKDYDNVIIYGDSALRKRYHTPDLYYMMGVSFEHFADYKNADWAYKRAMKSGYTRVPGAYPAFKARMKQREAEEKRRLKEEKQRQKTERKRLKKT